MWAAPWSGEGFSCPWANSFHLCAQTDLYSSSGSRVFLCFSEPGLRTLRDGTQERQIWLPLVPTMAVDDCSLSRGVLKRTRNVPGLAM